MEKCELLFEDPQDLDQVLGYLNYSSGNSDPNFLARLNRIWELVGNQALDQPVWRVVMNGLRRRLAQVTGQSAAFQDAAQATAVLDLVDHHVIPGYFRFHEDLLFHQNDGAMVNAFFLGRVCEAVLRQGGPWQDRERVTNAALTQLNDFVGYRPVPVLERRRMEPYPHERVRPVPLWIRGVGAAAGPYREVVELALNLLERTSPELMRQAQFDLSLLDEMAYDPRAYDFDHPANKRPNYHFGQWDPHWLDQSGYYRRYVVQQVTLDALMRRLDMEPDIPLAELKLEAGAVLAGTILMGAGVSGSGPEAYDSETTLTKLLPRIASYRDAFYDELIGMTTGLHRDRLLAEMQERRQPFGGARQHLNSQLARRRASQLEHVQLAGIFARLGYADEALQHALAVPAASARILCRVDCHMTAVALAIEQGERERALTLVAEVMQLVMRGIGCGAIVDPWSILGFDAQFSLFPAAENSVPDHRIDELIERMERLFGLMSRLWSEAAAVDEQDLCERVAAQFLNVATWWRKYAAHEVSNVTAIDVMDAYHAAEHVARALYLWHKGGAATGDIGFWAKHAEMFDSPQAYALVIDALIHQADFVASMGLLIHWLSQAERMPLSRGASSFHELAQRWLRELNSTEMPDDSVAAAELRLAAWRRARKFFDYLDANAGEFGAVPSFSLQDGSSKRRRPPNAPADPPPAEDEQDLFQAAYENVVFRDSADDGIEGAIFETDSTTNDELSRESERLGQRLAYFQTLAGLWHLIALAPFALRDTDPQVAPEVREDRIAAMQRWVEHAKRARTGLLELLGDVQDYALRAPSPDHDALVEYDRQRLVKEALLERIIATCVEVAAAARTLSAAVAAAQREHVEMPLPGDESSEELLSVAALAAVLRGDPDETRQRTTELMRELAERPLLYVPLAKNGQPREIVFTRIRQRFIQLLLKCLPRLGLLVETCRLLETAREMERNHPVGP
ncbi:MAG: hypothetical protein AB7O38_22515, partial [Pirellulaceae bacterium]